MERKKLLITAIAILMMPIGLPPGALAQAQSQCTALKYINAGRAVLKKAKCRAKALKKGLEVDPECLRAADARLVAKWARAEARGDCISSTDLALVESAVKAYNDEIEDALEPTPVLCCEFPDDTCWMGPGLVDPPGCSEFFATTGPPGSVCDGATGNCVTTTPAPGPCCAVPSAAVCLAGPGFDSAACATIGGYTASDVCLPNGNCSILSF